MTETQDHTRRELYDWARSEVGIERLLGELLDGVWYSDLQEPQNEWLSTGVKRALGYEESDVCDHATWWQGRLFEDDYQQVRGAIDKHGEGRNYPFEQILRCRHKRGTTVWFRCRSVVLRDRTGRPRRLVSTLTNVTAVQEQSPGQMARGPANPDFRELTDSLPQLIWTCDAKGNCDYLSQQWLRYTGNDPGEQMSTQWLDQVHPEDREHFLAQWGEGVAKGAEFSAEVRIRRHDGVYRWFDTRAVPLTDARGKRFRWVGSSTDITDRRRAMDAARKAQASVETVISNMSEGLVTCEINEGVVRWNPAGLAMHGFKRDEDAAHSLPALSEVFEVTTLTGDEVSFEEWPLNRVCRGESVRGVELRLRRRDMDLERVFSCNGSMAQLPDGERLAFLTITDLTERDRAVRALADSEQRLRVANEVAGIGTYELDYDTKQLRISPEMAALAGFPLETPLSLEQAMSLIHPADQSSLQLQQRVEQPDQPVPARELRVVRPDGEVRWLSWSSRVLVESGPGGSSRTKIVGACFDVTDQRLSKRRLTTHNAVNRVLAEATELSEATTQIMRAICEAEDLDFSAIWQIDEAAGVLRCSDVWHRPELHLDTLAAETRTLSFPLGVGLPGRVWKLGAPLLLDNVHLNSEYSRAPFARQHSLRSALAFPIVARGKVTGVVDFLGRSFHGPADKLLETVAPLGHQLGAFFERKRAEAERRDLEKQLQQAQKMDALGQLSGGIAHDFNNVLTAILSNAEIALLEAPRDSGMRENLKAIEEASHRAKNLVWQILAFARQQPQARRVVPLAPHIEESVRLLRATIPAGVELIVHCEPDIPDVLADGTQLQQVFLNLVTNAWHALEESKGQIVLSLSNVWVDTATARSISGLRSGRFARVTIRDTGHGMPAAVMDRMFEPFFTTKEPGRGTGLGLSVVHGIVRNHEGAITVESSVGLGTQVEVYFPAAQQRTPTIQPEQTNEEDGGQRRVLYIDDEQSLVSVAERTLGRLGYQVSGFTSPEKGIEAFLREPNAYALVATDLNMPSLSGVQVAAQLKAIRPDLPVLLLSGHISDQLRAAAMAVGVRDFLYKPYRIRELGDAVRFALRQSVQPAPR